MYLGIDFGTSGCRATVIDAKTNILRETAVHTAPPKPDGQRVAQSPQVWLDALDELLRRTAERTDIGKIKRLAIDGTSGSVLLTDPTGHPLTPALMYNDASSVDQLKRLQTLCPEPEHLCLNLSSGLVKALQLAESIDANDFLILNQADFIANHLCNRWGISDYHNALKLGYDCAHLTWPDWVQSLFPANSLPGVKEPGALIGTIDKTLARRYGLSEKMEICAGSTDANAAFLAAGLTTPGQAVTSLGSTLVLKLLSETPVQNLRSGVYSHRLGDYWLAGGASNAGAAILRDYFIDEKISALSEQIDPKTTTGLHYYPLCSVGERFPVYDPDKQPLLSPRPESDAVFLQAIFEGLAGIEKQGYDELKKLGAPTLLSVQTAGGGAKNPQWQAIRRKTLAIPVEKSVHSEASFGAALLARQGLRNYSSGQKKTAP